jgi:hypothetical protein
LLLHQTVAYFKNIGAASAWSRYSMLKSISTLFVFQNVDISSTGSASYLLFENKM